MFKHPLSFPRISLICCNNDNNRKIIHFLNYSFPICNSYLKYPKYFFSKLIFELWPINNIEIIERWNKEIIRFPLFPLLQKHFSVRLQTHITFEPVPTVWQQYTFPRPIFKRLTTANRVSKQGVHTLLISTNKTLNNNWNFIHSTKLWFHVETVISSFIMNNT